MVDTVTQEKWDKAAPTFDLMASRGAEVRWRPAKEALFARMGDGPILFMALGTGLDIPTFPPGKHITAIDISPKMLEQATARIAAYDGEIEARQMDVHEMTFADDSFDQVFTACTFCSVPDPVNGLKALYRVLKPGGELCMFEHTGSRFYPFKPMMDLMTKLTEKLGPAMNRPTVDNVKAAGFDVIAVDNIYLDVVKTIIARKPER
ncbi:methyltransferase domain-containing protein [Mangrovimicrobium sediminis]|uniref:Methyltransferase domain-containing protein n=1 Tax=Mangrovimicrobium sediminis TaxID=2562682 RepID=A0A4Z0LWC4_9GAMM|nr:class I SAM-dependent methyltransferase [Haliea sp. SAOS-164]TGD71559.1 methyltransferase domain-containing protein [Haliea sp. SAOS-164]